MLREGTVLAKSLATVHITLVFSLEKNVSLIKNMLANAFFYSLLMT